MALPPKICPDCREEYLHSVQSCVHCEVPLVLEEQLEDVPVEGLAPSSDLATVRTASAGWALALSERLVGAGIAHRVEEVSEGASQGGAQPYSVFVRAQDLERARVIDAEQMEREIPDLPEDWETAGQAGDGCPACGAELADEASECPECGLALALTE